jgi:hypothetical protein
VLQAKSRLGGSTDLAEREADAAARRALEPGDVVGRLGAASAGTAVLPLGIDAELQAATVGGEALPEAVRARFEPRFGQDFSQVRIHADARSALLAGALGARAFAFGPHIAFDAGEYAPGSAAGLGLLAHELAHVVQQGGGQQGGGPESGATLRRLSYADIKETAYAGLTRGLREAGAAARASLRKLAANNLPPSLLPTAETLIDIVDATIGAVFAVILAVIGIVVGFGEGVVGMVTGLVSLGYGVIRLLYDLVAGIFVGFDPLRRDLDAIIEALKALPGAIKRLVTDWLDAFEHASSERQSLMIGELTGQVLALIATFAVAAGRAGSVSRVAAGAEDLAGAAGRGGEVASAAGEATGSVARGRPVLQGLQGGGGRASGTVARGGAMTEGNAARALIPEMEAAQPAVRLAPPLVEAPPVAAPVTDAAKRAAAATGAMRDVAAAGGVAAARAAGTKEKDGRKPDPFRMRFQVQWDTARGGKGPTFSETATATADPGVTTGQATIALDGAMGQVVPKAARKAAEPAAEAQRKWIRKRPPLGLNDTGRSWSEYFDYGGYRDARVDVENQVGWNLRT